MRRLALGISNCRPAAGIVAAVREAEDLGAESAFVAEDVNCRDAFALCSLCAVKTSHIRLGPGVVNPFTRNPTALAMAAATLDEVSEGRAFVGIGTSSPSLIREQMGIQSPRPLGALLESVAILRGLLSGDDVHYRGDDFHYQDARLAFEPIQARVPIFFAAMGPRILRMAGRVADGVLLNVGASTEYVEWAVGQVRAGCQEAGRPPEDVTIAAWLSVYVTDDYEEGLGRARTWLATMLSIPKQGELLLEHAGIDDAFLPEVRARVSAYPHGGDPSGASEFVPPEIAARLAVIGNRDRVRARIEQYRAAGVDLPVVPPAALRALSQ